MDLEIRIDAKDSSACELLQLPTLTSKIQSVLTQTYEHKNHLLIHNKVT